MKTSQVLRLQKTIVKELTVSKRKVQIIGLVICGGT